MVHPDSHTKPARTGVETVEAAEDRSRGIASPNDRAPGAIGRRRVLECMAWAGTGLLWSMQSGVAKAAAVGTPASPHTQSQSHKQTQTQTQGSSLFFVQISDGHIGFNKGANPDVTQSLRAAVAKINALPVRPAFVVHTGDVSHLSRPEQFDQADQVLQGIKTGRIVYLPGEHDVIGDNGINSGSDRRTSPSSPARP